MHNTSITASNGGKLRHIPTNQGRRHEVLTRGDESGASNPPTFKSRFLLGFQPLYYENAGNSNKLGVSIEKFLYNPRLLGDVPSRIFNCGDAPSPPPPPGGDAHAPNHKAAAAFDASGVSILIEPIH